MLEDEEKHHRVEFEEPDEEPWLVSYADMMTLLFGFFVLMYSFAAAKQDTKSFETVKKAIAEQFGGKFVTNEVEEDSKKPPIVTASSFTSDWEIGTKKKETEKDGKNELMRKRGLREFNWSKSTPIKELEILFPIAKIFHASGETLSADGKEILSQLATEFRQRKTQDKLLVEVHGQPNNVSSAEALRLTAIQASEIMNVLVSSGVSPSDITAGGYGNLLIEAGALNATAPKKSNRRKYRRIVRFRIQEFIQQNAPMKE